MRHLLTILAALLLCASPAAAQTMKALMYGTNGNVIAPNIAFTNQVSVLGVNIASGGMIQYNGNDIYDMSANSFVGAVNFDSPASTRANLGFSTNLNTLWTATNSSNARSAIGLGATWLTNTNATNFRTAIGLGPTNTPIFNGVNIGNWLISTNASGHIEYNQIGLGESALTLRLDTLELGNSLAGDVALAFNSNNATGAATTRTNLGLGGNSIVTFAGLTNNGDITINGTAATNGLLFIRRTNNEAFLGMANLIASNNTTISNETLFRVGVAEATNRAAQFGFRTVRTNNGGEGFATFSVFGYNALMMIGPSDRSRTNTATNAGIEADIWTITPTNRVMTLRDTNTGALTMHQDLGFGAGLTNAAPTNTNTPAVWLRVWVGTNNYRLPLYQ